MRVAFEFEDADVEGEGIEEHQSSAQGFAQVEQDFDGLQGLQCAHATDDGGEDAVLRAGFSWLVVFGSISRSRVEAVVAGAGFLAGIKYCELAFKADGGGGDQWFAGGNTGAVNGVAAGEVVGAVEHDVGGLYGGEQGLIVERGRQGVDVSVGVEGKQVVAGGFDFCAAKVSGAVDDLALQVGKFNLVKIHEG